MYLIAFPLLLVSFALYNMILFLLNMPFTDTAASIPLMDDRRMSLTLGDLLVLFSFLLLYLEVLKAARFPGKSVMDHLLAFILLVAMVAELVFVPRAMTPTLLLLAGLSFIDVLTGISLSFAARSRRIRVENPDHASSA
jgi:hypothetical protein